jgi:hypothetical protein
VAVSAINAIVADVVFVAELHRLLFFEVAARQIGRPRDLRIRIERSPA